MKEATLEIHFPDPMKVDKKSKIKENKIFSHSKVLEKSIAYFKGDELAAIVWINKYALKDSSGNIYESSPDEMHHRIAAEIQRVENRYNKPLSYEQIYKVLKDFKYIVPQGGSMAGIGNAYQIASLSNCFVVGQEGVMDSYGAILKTDEEQVQLMKRRGGVGHDLSHLRPKGSAVLNSALTSTGVVPFMERYSNSTREVAQDGRRGALMLSISIKHPDAEDFIDAKLDGKKVTGANVSVRIDDEFMNAVQKKSAYTQFFPLEGSPQVTREIKATDLWQKIVYNAWQSAEPGILFWDTIRNESIPDCYQDKGFKTVSTNPCGEIPLCPYDSCRLLAINLYSYVVDPFGPKTKFDSKLFKKHVAIAQRIMDDIVDLEIEKIDKIIQKIKSDPESEEVKRTELNLWEKIKIKCIEGRRIGLGITGEGDMLAALGLKYGSQEAVKFSVDIHKTLAMEAYRASTLLAKERGAFPIYDPEKEQRNPFIARLKNEDPALFDQMVKDGRRNIALLTIAPTGSTSLMTQTTSGIEPVFMVSYKRRRKVNPNEKNTRVDFLDDVGDAWEEYLVFHHNFRTWMLKNGYKEEKLTRLDEKGLNKIVEKSPYHQATARDVDWVKKVKMQGAIQKWVDHSISVTVNLPQEASADLIGEIYMTGWKSGCKGITVYREGSRSGVMVSDSDQNTAKKDFSETNAPKRPKCLEAEVIRFQNNNEKWIAVVGLYQERPYEIFTGNAEDSFAILSQVDYGWVIKSFSKDGKSRYDFQYEDKDGYKTTIEGLSRSFDSEYWNYAKLISGVLRHGMPIQFVVDIVSKLNLNDESLNTWKNGVGRALRKFIPDGTKPSENYCPECGDSALMYVEGCLTCKSCGHTKCE